MFKKILCIIFTVLFSASVVAVGGSVVCSVDRSQVFDSYLKSRPLPQFKKWCTDLDSSLEQCSQFQIKYSGQLLSNFDLDIPLQSGTLDFKPVAIAAVYNIAQPSNPQWLILLEDNSGSPTRAQERWLYIDSANIRRSILVGAEQHNAMLAARNLSWFYLHPLKCQ